MEFSISPVVPDRFHEWLRLRESVYTGIDREFHRCEMELMFHDGSRECLAAGPGLGLSRRLITSAEEWCRSKGGREIATDAELHNESSQSFHHHMGFAETYRHPVDSGRVLGTFRALQRTSGSLNRNRRGNGRSPRWRLPQNRCFVRNHTAEDFRSAQSHKNVCFRRMAGEVKCSG